jgi:hypothetical protein
MNEIEFLVQGSDSEPYRVIFSKNAANLRATCTCRAGEVGQYCKHRIRIIDGDSTGIVSDNMSAVPEIKIWAIGSDVERAILELRDAEQQLEEAKRRVASYKKKLARTLLD